MKNFGDDLPQYVLATFKDRFFAMFLDFSIILLFSFPLSIILAAIEAFLMFNRGGQLGLPLTLVFMGIRVFMGVGVSIFYFGYFYKKRGTSLGKDILNLRVVCLPYAERPTYKTALLRDFFGKMLSVLSFFMGYLMVLFRKDRKALHDLIADTIILKRVR